MKLPAYPRYKSSGINWLGNIPEKWQVKRLKYSASINDETLPETTAADFEFSYVDIGGVDSIEGIKSIDVQVFEGAPSRARRVVREGDTIVSTVRTYLRAIAAIAAPPKNLIVSTGFAVVRPRQIEPSFLGYALREFSFVETLVSRSVGVSYPAVNASEVSTIPIPLPLANEQRAIAGFLDRETGRLDRLIAKKRELVERLKEKRTALISHAVAGGLPLGAALAVGLLENPPLKSSGLDWLGLIPSHWDVVKVKFVAAVESGHTPSRTNEELWVDCTIPWVSLNDSKALRKRDYITDTHYQISELGIQHSSARMLPARAVVFSRDATVGLCAITTRPMAVSQHFVAYLCGPRLLPEYLLFCLKAMGQELDSLSWGSTIPTIGMDDIGALRCPLPPFHEQQAIADYINRETAKLDSLVSKIETAIERLREYRTALITAAVTGKIDVRNAVEIT